MQLGFCLAKLNSRAGGSEAIIVGKSQTARGFEAGVLFFKICGVCGSLAMLQKRMELSLAPCQVEFLWNSAIFLTPSLKLWSKYGGWTFLNDFMPFYPQLKRKILNRPKEICSQYKSTAAIFSFSLPICPVYFHLDMPRHVLSPCYERYEHTKGIKGYVTYYKACYVRLQVENMPGCHLRKYGWGRWADWRKKS